ncbi:MAG: peptide/nickel transport system permease protein/oligopeptide transport system permease protein [Verrucomicrobia bacterium]|nr:MAG: peptide/nickel transport system permease protein/oligopeptide transport system permease protein [Verrucomicrobiota bacterium]
MKHPIPLRPGLLRRLLQKPAAAISLLLLLAILAAAVFLPVFLKCDPHLTSSQTFLAPTQAHPFGTDLNGRDLLSRTLEGARISLLVGCTGAAVSLLIGTSVGLLAGYAGGALDAVLMRLVDILYAVPRLILIILAGFLIDPWLQRNLATFQDGRWVGYSKIAILILALGCIEWLTMARIVRGQVLALKTLPFVEAARVLGQSPLRILFKHLLPNLSGVIVVYLTLTVPAVILDESFLSFLGMGVQAPQASWGTLLSDGATALNPIQSHWWLLLFPAAAMSLTLLSLNFLGDALRDSLAE